MKAILITIVLALSVQAQAADKLTCDYYADQAQEIMEKRQNMMPVRQVLAEHAKDSILQRMVENAYSSIRFRTQKNKDNEVVRFENLVYLRCAKGRANNAKT